MCARSCRPDDEYRSNGSFVIRTAACLEFHATPLGMAELG